MGELREENVGIERSIRLAIFLQGTPKASETFIDSLISRVPFDKLVIVKEKFGWRVWGGRRSGALSEIVERCLRKIGWNLGGNMKDRALSRLLRRVGANVVLAEYGTTAAMVVRACSKAKIPLVAHFRGYDAYMESVVNANSASYKIVFEYASVIVAKSEHMAKRLASLGADRKKIIISPSGVDEIKASQQVMESRKRDFLAVGRFVEKKGPLLVLLAFERVASLRPQATLTMVGAGPLLGAAFQIAEATGLKGKVEFLGELKHDRVLRLMQSHRAFVQHSVTAQDGDSEGMPVAILEALYSGLPVICSDHAGISEVVQNGLSGILVPELDIQKMADAMIWVLDHEREAASMGSAGKQRVLSAYTTTHHIHKIAEAIKASV